MIVGDTEETNESKNKNGVIEPAQIVELDEERNSMRILWKVSDYVLGTHFDGDAADAQAMIFATLDITDTQIIFLDKMCVDVVFKQDSVVIAEFLANTWQETPQSLGIETEKEGTRIRTNCELFGFSEYLRLSDGRLVVPNNNVFYFFDPNVVY